MEVCTSIFYDGYFLRFLLRGPTLIGGSILCIRLRASVKDLKGVLTLAFEEVLPVLTRGSCTSAYSLGDTQLTSSKSSKSRSSVMAGSAVTVTVSGLSEYESSSRHFIYGSTYLTVG